MGIESLCISKIVDKFGKIACHIVRAHGSLVFQPFPTVLILPNEKSFSQIGRLRFVKYYKIDWFKMKNYIFQLSYRQIRNDVCDPHNDQLQY